MGAVEDCGLGFRIHIEDVLAAPACGTGIVLDRAEPPVGTTSHRINRDAPQEADLAIVSGAESNSVDKSFQVRRIALDRKSVV